MNFASSLRRAMFILVIATGNLCAQEICDNGIDDDNDGLIDLKDVGECRCTGIGTTQQAASLIPNASFEEMDCCPVSFSMMDCATSWIQATDATSDYFNTCDYVAPAATDAGLLPFPDGNGAVGALYLNDWQEYVGACLDQPMLAGTLYRIDLNVAFIKIDGFGEPCTSSETYSPTEIVIYGNPSCNRLPLFTTGCPPDADATWVELGSVGYAPGTISGWSVVTITFTPAQDINAVMLGSPCNLTPEYNDFGTCMPYFMFDNLVLNAASSFTDVTILPDGNYCTNDLSLNAEIDTFGGEWQWYLDGVALPGETNAVLQVSSNGLGVGDYTARYTLGPDCEIGVYNLSSPQLTLIASGNTCDNNLQIRAESSAGGGAWQWYRNGTEISGEIADVIHVPPTITGTDVFEVRYTGASVCQAKSWSLYVPAISVVDTGKYCNQNLVLIATPDSAGGEWEWRYEDLVLFGEADSVLEVSAENYETGDYTVSYFLGNGCAEVTHAADDCNCGVSVPEAFSPNGDTRNDMFTIFSECVEKLKSLDIKIFNRWGEVVFQSDNINTSWDGRYKGQEANLGVYTYLITYTKDAEPQKVSGNLTLLR